MTHYKKSTHNGVTAGSNKLLFLNCIQGASAFKLGRILCCYRNIYWYAHNDNGFVPWKFHNPRTDGESTLLEAQYSKYHFDRLVKNDHNDRRVYVPIVGSKIEKYWDNTNWINRWEELMSTIEIPSPDKYLLFIVHDSPKYLRNLFPRSYIINLISDPVTATNRHLKTSANYRIDYQFENQRPDYKSTWVQQSEKLLEINPNATERDLWIYTNNSNEEEYEQYMYKVQTEMNLRNKSEHKFANLTMSWDTFDPYTLEETFGKINDNFKKLL